jgi:hypothetical protein
MAYNRRYSLTPYQNGVPAVFPAVGSDVSIVFGRLESSFLSSETYDTYTPALPWA